MIKIKKLYPHKFAWYWNGDARVLLIGVYYFTIGLDFGLRQSNWYKHFFKRTCPVCKLPLNPTSRDQIIKFHRPCRTMGRKIERAAAKLLRRQGQPQSNWIQRLLTKLRPNHV